MDNRARIEALNQRFGVAGVAQIVAGRGGLPVVDIRSPAARAEVSLYGAHVIRWKPAAAEEVLFMSEASHWEEGRAIRGGIPVCFPWFGDKADDPEAPKHGFVRLKEWRLDSLTHNGNGSVALLCVTESDASSRAWWPHEYRVEYRITVGAKLGLELKVINTGKARMRFEEALHSYFQVGNVQDASVHGLGGVPYLDKTDSYREKMQPGAIDFTGRTDRVFLNTRSAVDVVDRPLRRLIRTEKLNSQTTVVWNPWVEGAAEMTDFGDDEWERMVAVEGSNVLDAAILLDPGEEHTLRVTISALPA